MNESKTISNTTENCYIPYSPCMPYNPTTTFVYPVSYSTPKTCPVCRGKQTVAAKFYADHKGSERPLCRSCGGRGYILCY